MVGELKEGNAMKHDMQAWLAGLFGPGPKKPLPILSFPGAQWLGVCVRSLVTSAQLQADCMLAVAKRTPAAAAVSPMDLSVEAECFGAPVRFADDEVPTIPEAIVQDEEDARRLPVPAVGAGRTGLCLEAVSKAAALPLDRPVLAGVIGPYSLAGRLMGVTDILYACFDEPETVHLVLEKATRFLKDYMLAFRQAGANGIILAEPLAGLLSPAMGGEFSCEYVARLIADVQSEDFPVIYHNCGDATIPMASQIASIGAKAYHFGNAIRLADILPLMPKDALVMGNVDPAGQFSQGTPASIEADTRRVLQECSGFDNFLLSSGCDIPPQASWDNIDAFFQASQAFYLSK